MSLGYTLYPHAKSDKGKVIAFAAKTVLLLHTLADGSAHYDWLLETSPSADLLTFRTQARLPRLAIGSETLARLLPDHRRVYLTFEGALTENRGTVRRVAAGAAQIVRSPKALQIEVLWGGGRQSQLWRGQPAGGGDPLVWRFVSLPLAP